MPSSEASLRVAFRRFGFEDPRIASFFADQWVIVANDKVVAICATREQAEDTAMRCVPRDLLYLVAKMGHSFEG